MSASIGSLTPYPIASPHSPRAAAMAAAVRNGLKTAARKWEAARQGLEAHDFPCWTPELESALDRLPPLPNCPSALLRVLLEPRADTPKRIVLLTDHGTPAGVVALRLTPWGWEPLTTWIVPGPPIPAREGDLARVLLATGLTMKVAFWRYPPPAQDGEGMALLSDEPTYAIDLASDYAAHWRHGHVQSVKKAVRRCAGFRFEMNPPGGARWTVTQCGQKWGIPAGITEDRAAVTEWLEQQGRNFTAVLFDEERPVAGNAISVDRGDLIGCTMYRDPDYDRCGVGLALMHHVLEWTSAQPFARLDFGGGGKAGGNWKNDWAPEAGRKYVLRVTPRYARVAAWLRRLRRPVAAAPVAAVLALLLEAVSSLADWAVLATVS